MKFILNYSVLQNTESEYNERLMEFTFVFL